MNQTAWLWGLTALTIPVAIHLLSSKSARVIFVGSLRHFSGTDSSQFRGIRLNEIALLLIRMMLITILVLALAGAGSGSFNDTSRWVVVEKSIKDFHNARKLTDSLVTAGYEAHWLAEGFPSMADSLEAPELNYWQLSNSLNAQKIKEAVVLYSGMAVNFRGRRYSAPASQRWIPIPYTKHEDYTLTSTKISHDSVLIRQGFSTDQITRFENKLALAAPGDTASSGIIPKARVVIVSDDSLQTEAKIIRTAIESLNQIRLANFEVTMKQPADAQPFDGEWIIWNSYARLNNEAGDSTRLIRRAPQLTNTAWFQKANGRIWLSRRVTQREAIESNLPVAFAQILLENKISALSEKEHDLRVLPEGMSWSGEPAPAETKSLPQPSTVSAWLLGAFALLLISERLIAKRRMQ